MSDAFDKLKELLTNQNALSKEDIEKAVAEHGEITDEERVWLEAERHRLERASTEIITMEQYLDALKVLDTAAEGSEDYVKAEAIVDKYEKGS